jgi:predicted transcriptional regulator
MVVILDERMNVKTTKDGKLTYDEIISLDTKKRFLYPEYL